MKDSEELAQALKGVNCVVMCTGVSAFPTANWGELTVDLAAEGGFWKKFQWANAVQKVDAEGPANVVQTWCKSNGRHSVASHWLMICLQRSGNSLS